MPHAKQKRLDGVLSEGEGAEGDGADGYDGYGKRYDGDGIAGYKGDCEGCHDAVLGAV